MTDSVAWMGNARANSANRKDVICSIEGKSHLDQNAKAKTLFAFRVIVTAPPLPQAISTPLLVFLCSLPNQLLYHLLLIPLPQGKKTQTAKLLTAKTAQNAPPIIFANPCSKIQSSR